MNETITTNAATGAQPRTGNWAARGTVAAGRGIALAGLTLAGLVLWVVFATAVALAPFGIGLPAIPVTVRAIRRLETRVRRLAGDWCGAAIGDPYQPEPARREGQPPSFWARFGFLIADPATWRDLVWITVDTLVGWLLAPAVTRTGHPNRIICARYYVAVTGGCRGPWWGRGSRTPRSYGANAQYTPAGGSKPMKAVVYTRYGPPDMLRLAEVATPAPKDNEVLVKVHAVSVNASDWETLRGKPLYSRIGGPFRPRYHILGSDIAGRVEAVGRKATLFRPGEEVFADILSYMGGFAEYVCVPQRALARLPAGMTYEQAAALPQAGAIALQGILDRGQVQPGQTVLVNGAGGGSGMYAIQLAKLHRAEVTGVDNTEKLEFMRSLGADHVIDYTRDDFTKNGRRYDLILDLAAHRPAVAYKGSLTSGGRYLYVGGSVATLVQVLLLGPLIGRTEGKKIRLLAVRLGAQHLAPLVELCQAGNIATVIDRSYRLSEVPEALRYLGEGHAKGKVVITVE